MGETLEGKFSGFFVDLPPGRHGGTCDLTLAEGHFELQIVEYAPFSIQEGETFRGRYTESDDGIVLEAREYYAYYSETEMREWTGSTSRQFVATFAGPESNRAGVLAVRINIDWRPYRVLLLRDGADSDLAAWFEAECAQGRAKWEAEQARRDHERLHERVAALAVEAFRAKNYRRVVTLLESLGERLTSAERKKLEYARKHL